MSYLKPLWHFTQFVIPFISFGILHFIYSILYVQSIVLSRFYPLFQVYLSFGQLLCTFFTIACLLLRYAYSLQCHIHLLPSCFPDYMYVYCFVLFDFPITWVQFTFFFRHSLISFSYQSLPYTIHVCVIICFLVTNVISFA